MLNLAVVFQGKQMLLLHDCLAVSQEVKCHTAHLCTFPSVGTSSKQGLTRIASSTQTHAQCPMHKDLEFGVRTFPMDVSNFINPQLSRQDHLTKPQCRKQLHFLHRAVVHLCAGMKWNRGQVQRQQTQILHNQCIHVDVVQFPDELFHLLHLLLKDKGVHRYIDFRLVQMGKRHQSLDVLHAVACSRTGTMRCGTYINSISTVAYCLDANVCGFCWSEKFDKSHGKVKN